MENNTNLPENTSGSIPTVAEIMNEVAQISAAGNAEVPSVSSIETPTVTDIPEVPFVEVYSSEQAAESAQTTAAPNVEASAPVAQPTQQLPVQTTPEPVAVPAANTAAYTQPVQPVQPTQPIQTAQPAYSPYATQQVPSYPQTYAAQPVNTNKRGAGKIIAIILGVLLTLFGAVLAIADVAVAVDTAENGGLDGGDIFAFCVMLLPLILGIILLIVGIKKKKNPTVSNPAVGYAAPVMQNAAPVQNAYPTTSVNQQNGAPVANTMNYQYANTGLIQDESAKMVKKSARNSGLGAIALVVLFWVLLFFVDTLFYWLLIIPFILAFGSLKSSGAKSIAGWIGMIMSVLSVVFLILGIALSIAG